MPSIKVVLSARAQSDIGRLHRFLVGKDVLAAKRAVLTIRDAFLPLKETPFIGRSVEDHTDLRELVIDFGASGYIALYRHDLASHSIIILAIKHQREDDYR